MKSPGKKKEERDKDDKDALIGLTDASIEKKIQYLRWFLNWATSEGYNNGFRIESGGPLYVTMLRVYYYAPEGE